MKFIYINNDLELFRVSERYENVADYLAMKLSDADAVFYTSFLKITMVYNEERET